MAENIEVGSVNGEELEYIWPPPSGALVAKLTKRAVTWPYVWNERICVLDAVRDENKPRFLYWEKEPTGD